MTLDGALVDRAQQSFPVLLRERGWEHDLDADAGNPLTGGVPLGIDRQREPLGVQVALLAEAQRVEARARSDRGEKEIERRRGSALTPLEYGLVRADPRPLVERIDAEAPRKMNVHRPSMRWSPVVRMMQTNQRQRLSASSRDGFGPPASRLYAQADAHARTPTI